MSTIQEEKLHLQKCIGEKERGKVFSWSIQVHNSLEKKDSREISTQSSSKKSISLNPPSALKDGQDAFEKTNRQIQCEVESLEDDIQLAQAKLHSLEEIPSHQPWYGRANFTCTNCHYKCHKVSKPCTLPACGGYECGILAMYVCMYDLYLNKIKIKATNLWGHV